MSEPKPIVRPGLAMRLALKLVRLGLLRVPPDSLLGRLFRVWKLLSQKLWSTLNALSPHPYQCLYNLLIGKHTYPLRLDPNQSPQLIKLSPPNLVSFLALYKKGFRPIAYDQHARILTWQLAPDLRFQTRTFPGWDLSVLVETFGETHYDTNFRDKRIIDIGAYIGDTSTYFASKGAREVVALEPSPSNLEIARQNIQQSPFEGTIKLLPIGIAAQNGHFTLFTDAANTMNDALIPTSESQSKLNQPAQLHIIEVWSFERLLEHLQWPEVDIVKLDCEGAEYPILLETPDHILLRVKEWIMEYHGDPKPLRERLEKLGYTVEHLRDRVSLGILRAKRAH